MTDVGTTVAGTTPQRGYPEDPQGSEAAKPGGRPGIAAAGSDAG
jgi:hypothetical protein